jgi:hypothetical protein
MSDGKKNSFSLGAQVGGPDRPEAVDREDQRLRNAFNFWTGQYTDAVREFAFLLRVDGSLNRYTEEWNILGAQPAKRKSDWVEVEIGVPQNWWEMDGVAGYRKRLTQAIDEGFRSMIALLQRNKHEIDGEALLNDWEGIKRDFLDMR